eukprot:5708179-Pyramimonas_sp.AAC.1
MVVPVLTVQDATGCSSCESLQSCVSWYTSHPGVLKILTDYEHILMVNIANEWSCGSNPSEFRAVYVAAVTQLRACGVRNILVIDAAGDTIITPHPPRDPQA